MERTRYPSEREAIESLQRRGFSARFRAEENNFSSIDNKKSFRPEDLKIVEIHRFEGATDVDDMSIVYGLESNDGTKGILIDAFGPYSDPKLAPLIERVPVQSE